MYPKVIIDIETTFILCGEAQVFALHEWLTGALMQQGERQYVAFFNYRGRLLAETDFLRCYNFNKKFSN
ncbi:hypothetical protein CV093_14830 [Oceanobacillus sp. 143]|nr:hypothetical protein CV093_14830 [Oceanobacillus sp. 143]